MSERNWPKLTRVQRDLLLEIERSKYKCMRIDGARYLQTVWALVAKGMLDSACNSTYELSERGKDYLRFGMRRHASQSEAGEE